MKNFLLLTLVTFCFAMPSFGENVTASQAPIDGSVQEGLQVGDETVGFVEPAAEDQGIQQQELQQELALRQAEDTASELTETAPLSVSQPLATR